MQIYKKNFPGTATAGRKGVVTQRGHFVLRHKNASLFKESELSPQEYGIRETTLRGYSEPFRDLNIERLPFNSMRDLTVVERSAVLNGILQTPTLHASTLTVPKPHLQLLQTATLSHLGAKKKYAGTSVSGRSEYASENGRRPSRLRSKLKRGGGYRHQGRSLYTRE